MSEQDKRTVKVTIATPTPDYIYPEYMVSIIQAMNMARKYERLNIEVEYSFVKGYFVDKQRNQLAKDAIDKGFDYILYIDSDTTIPPRAIKDLVQCSIDMNLNILAGWQHKKKSTKNESETFRKQKPEDNGLFYRYSVSTLESMIAPVEIYGTGFGCILIRTDVLKKFFDAGIPPFKYTDATIESEKQSEDIYFSCKARELFDEKTYVLPSVKCGHMWLGIY